MSIMHNKRFSHLVLVIMPLSNRSQESYLVIWRSSPLQRGFPPVHVPLLLHVSVVDPVRKYPLSQENWQVCPGKFEHNAKLPWDGAYSWGQRFTIHSREE